MTAAEGILIVGGYGHVGSRIATRLLAAGIAPVKLAGRDAEKAKAMAARLNCETCRIDLDRRESWDEALAGTGIVVVCIDQKDHSFPAHVLAKGMTYLDITASDPFFRQVESLDGAARESGGRAILSIGLAPRLTNLLVKACVETLDHANNARIGIMLGLGDDHGQAAIDWTLHEFPGSGKGLLPIETIPFGVPPRGCPAVPFDFADQHVVRRTLGLRDTRTFVTFDPAIMSRVVFKLLQSIRSASWLAPIARWAISHARLGSDRAALAVEVHGELDGQAEVRRAVLEGRREADVTALVAALTVKHIMRAPGAPGVRHIDQIVSIDDLAPALHESGILLHLP